MNTITSIGLFLDFVGVIFLLVYATKTIGATTPADQDHVASPWWWKLGYGLIAAGFLAQFVASLADHS